MVLKQLNVETSIITSFSRSFKMSIPLTHVILVILPVLVFSAERNSSCTTPNGEQAVCTPILSCLVMQQAILSSDKSAIDFAKQSQCGYDTQPLICCGSTGFYNNKFPESSLLPDRSNCGFMGLKLKNRGQIGDNQICAGGDKGQDACQGDSGGPLMGSSETKDQRKQWHHEGVIAWGIGCGGKNMPGVYTRTTKYLQWILDNMSEF